MNSLVHNENEWIRRFKEGDERAFTIIYDHFYFGIYQYAKRWLKSKEEAEDVTCSTFCKLLDRREQFVNLDNIAAFLKITARNTCFNLLKHARVKKEKQADLLREMELQETPDFTWLELREEFLKLVYAEVDKMPGKMKEVFLLSFRDGLKPSEIAWRLDLKVQTVSNQKSNAIKLLKAAFANRSFVAAFLVFLEQDHFGRL